MRANYVRRIVSLLLLLLCGMGQGGAGADDGMFPAAPAARAAIDFDGKGFLAHGTRVFLASGSLHYSRVPHALWRDRLLRIKRAGFNTVETYAFWNFHEPQEGKWDFTGDRDLNAYLKLIKELGMYAIVRVGPYVCAEWEGGGYPVWLRFKPGARVREDNPAFEAAADRWFEKVMPIVAANQIHRGGAVILVQLENEHPQGWGREMPNGYFKHLRDKAVALGLEVPYFFSGLHHGHDPAGDRPWDSAGRSNPWFTTEFWAGWYNLYGPLNLEDLRTYDRGMWKILAYGGNGYNIYMLHGGTNFDTWNNDEVASNYDYGAAVGQTGDLRPLYYRFKRASLFARSFADVLENSVNATDAFKNAAVSGEARVTARRSPNGTLVFVDNPGAKPLLTQVKDESGKLIDASDSIALAPGEIVPCVLNYSLTPDVKLEASACRILGIARQGDTTTLVIYDASGGAQETRNENNILAGHAAALRFRVPTGQASIVTGASGLTVDAMDAGRVVLKTTFPTQGAAEYTFAVNKQRIRVLAVSSDLADRTYFVEAGGVTYVIGGFPYIGEVQAQNGQLQIVTEQYARRQPIPEADCFAYGPGDKPLRLQVVKLNQSANQPTPLAFDSEQFPNPVLSPWQMRRADGEAAPAYLTGSWKYSPQPQQMGADGDTSAYAWYRATTQIAKEGAYTLQFTDSGDWIAVFVNGQRVAIPTVIAEPRQRYGEPVPRAVPAALKAGENNIAVLTAHYGRNKLFNHLGPIDQVAAKGLNGPVILSRQPQDQRAVEKWQWKTATIKARDIPVTLPADISAGQEGWKTLTDPKDDVFQKQRGFAWFRIPLEAIPGPHRQLHFENVDDNATLYLNGKKIGEHQGWGVPFDVVLDGAWHESGANQLVVLVENMESIGGIPGAVTLLSFLSNDKKELRGWKMRGGIGVPLAATGWQPVADRVPLPGVPTFFRADFVTAPPEAAGLHPIWRVTLTGLSRGFIWLNGHNLGRYPEKVPIKSLYLPECWLLKGSNSLVIYDEEGNSPAQARVVAEPAASRVVREYVARPEIQQ